MSIIFFCHNCFIHNRPTDRPYFTKQQSQNKHQKSPTPIKNFKPKKEKVSHTAQRSRGKRKTERMTRGLSKR